MWEHLGFNYTGRWDRNSGGGPENSPVSTLACKAIGVLKNCWSDASILAKKAYGPYNF